jgi:hypothetical protein
MLDDLPSGCALRCSREKKQALRLKSLFYRCGQMLIRGESDAANANVFHFHEIVHSIDGTFTTKSGLLDATKRGNFV